MAVYMISEYGKRFRCAPSFNKIEAKTKTNCSKKYSFSICARNYAEICTFKETKKKT